MEKKIEYEIALDFCKKRKLLLADLLKNQKLSVQYRNRVGAVRKRLNRMDMKLSSDDVR